MRSRRFGRALFHRKLRPIATLHGSLDGGSGIDLLGAFPGARANVSDARLFPQDGHRRNGWENLAPRRRCRKRIRDIGRSSRTDRKEYRVVRCLELVAIGIGAHRVRTSSSARFLVSISGPRGVFYHSRRYDSRLPRFFIPIVLERQSNLRLATRTQTQRLGRPHVELPEEMRKLALDLRKRTVRIDSVSPVRSGALQKPFDREAFGGTSALFDVLLREHTSKTPVFPYGRRERNNVRGPFDLTSSDAVETEKKT